MAYEREHPEKKDLIGLQEAADYLKCSHQVLSKMLKNKDEPLRQHFRFYAGSYRTTYALLDEFFTNGEVQYIRKTYDSGDNDGSNEPVKE